MTRESQEHLQYTLATHAVEHLTPSDEALRLCRQVSEGALKAEEAVAELLRRHGVYHD